MPFSLAEVLQFEKWTEQGFVELLSTACKNVYDSMDIATADSPRVIVRVTIGEINGNHEHVFTEGGADESGHFRSAFDAYDAIVEMEIATNRETEAKTDAHYLLVGAVRAIMQRDYVVINWNQNNPIYVNDVRQQATERTVDADKNLDITTIPHYFLFNVKPESWPPNFK